MRNFLQSLRQRIQRIRHHIRNRNADRDMALLDADLEYRESQTIDLD